ncbi:MAG TPA: hypothetical protein VHB73_03870 [Alphaproteobacteria bacterium]|nr:hypothetical protein [Alphaproteobacteria bacterium]
MEVRQQRIANLADHLLPFMEAQEQKQKFIAISHRLLLLILTAVIAFSSAQYLRPITYSEARSLRMMLEYVAQKKNVPVENVAAPLLAHLHVHRLGDIRAYQWQEAVSRLSADTE